MYCLACELTEEIPFVTSKQSWGSVVIPGAC